MNFKTKALFLFGILLIGLGLSYFLGGIFTEGFDTPSVSSNKTIPASTSAASTSTPAASTSTPAASTSTTANAPSSWDWIQKLNETTNMTPPASTTVTSSNTTTQPTSYDNYNHYNDKNQLSSSQLSSTQYYGSTGTPINPMRSNDKEAPEPNNTVSNGVSNGLGNGYGTQYSSTMPPGIPASQILPGDEHLYILKSEIVPPVCPVCPAFPSASAIHNEEPPPPCPPCGRCPEPSFECKKVPNYNATNGDSMPVPVLNDFSSFGM